MFKHILIPTDGSEASQSAFQAGIALAKESGAEVTGIHVTPEFYVFTYDIAMLEDTREQFAKEANAQAGKYLAGIEVAAKEAGVKCDTLTVTSDHPYEAIVNARTG